MCRVEVSPVLTNSSSRNYLDEITWNRQPPVPELPTDIVEKTREKYLEAFRVLSGRELG